MSFVSNNTKIITQLEDSSASTPTKATSKTKAEKEKAQTERIRSNALLIDLPLTPEDAKKIEGSVLKAEHAKNASEALKAMLHTNDLVKKVVKKAQIAGTKFLSQYPQAEKANNQGIYSYIPFLRSKTDVEIAEDLTGKLVHQSKNAEMALTSYEARIKELEGEKNKLFGHYQALLANQKKENPKKQELFSQLKTLRTELADSLAICNNIPVSKYQSLKNKLHSLLDGRESEEFNRNLDELKTELQEISKAIENSESVDPEYKVLVSSIWKLLNQISKGLPDAKLEKRIYQIDKFVEDATAKIKERQSPYYLEIKKIHDDTHTFIENAKKNPVSGFEVYEQLKNSFKELEKLKNKSTNVGSDRSEAVMQQMVIINTYNRLEGYIGTVTPPQPKGIDLFVNPPSANIIGVVKNKLMPEKPMEALKAYNEAQIKILQEHEGFVDNLLKLFGEIEASTGSIYQHSLKRPTPDLSLNSLLEEIKTYLEEQKSNLVIAKKNIKSFRESIINNIQQTPSSNDKSGFLDNAKLLWNIHWQFLMDTPGTIKNLFITYEQVRSYAMVNPSKEMKQLLLDLRHMCDTLNDDGQLDVLKHQIQMNLVAEGLFKGLSTDELPSAKFEGPMGEKMKILCSTMHEAVPALSALRGLRAGSTIPYDQIGMAIQNLNIPLIGYVGSGLILFNMAVGAVEAYNRARGIQNLTDNFSSDELERINFFLNFLTAEYATFEELRQVQDEWRMLKLSEQIARGAKPSITSKYFTEGITKFGQKIKRAGGKERTIRILLQVVVPLILSTIVIAGVIGTVVALGPGGIAILGAAVGIGLALAADAYGTYLLTTKIGLLLDHISDFNDTTLKVEAHRKDRAIRVALLKNKPQVSELIDKGLQTVTNNIRNGSYKVRMDREFQQIQEELEKREEDKLKERIHKLLVDDLEKELLTKLYSPEKIANKLDTYRKEIATGLHNKEIDKLYEDVYADSTSIKIFIKHSLYTKKAVSVVSKILELTKESLENEKKLNDTKKDEIAQQIKTDEQHHANPEDKALKELLSDAQINKLFAEVLTKVDAIDKDAFIDQFDTPEKKMYAIKVALRNRKTPQT